MEAMFDRLTKIVASDMSRRDAVKAIGGLTFGAVLMGLGVRTAMAGAKCDFPGVCGTYQNCNGSSTCFCGTTPKTAINGKGFCFEDALCSGLIGCTTNKECKTALGRGHKCLLSSCCQTNVCIAKCGGAPTTPLDAGGPTAGRG